jgi:hypothetical protein
VGGIMVDEITFAAKFRKMVTLCNYPQGMLKDPQVDTFYDALKFNDERTLLSAFAKICSSPPNKLTLSVILHHVNELKPKKECSDWTERECNVEGCERGLISEQIGKYSVLFKCTSCDSSKLKFINDHTTENVFNEQQKHKPVERVKEPTKIQELTRGIG